VLQAEQGTEGRDQPWRSRGCGLRTAHRILRQSLVRHLAALACDSCDCHHSSGVASFRAVRKERPSVTRGAFPGNRDLLLGHARFDELATIRLAQVEVEPDAGVAMSRGASIQEKQRVLLPHRIGLLYFVEQFAGVGELRLKLVSQIIAYSVAAFLDAGTNRGVDVLRLRPELVT